MVLLVLLILAGGIYWYFSGQQTGNAPGTTGGLSVGGLFPFGHGSSGTDTNSSGGQQNQPTTGLPGSNTQNTPGQIPPRLWQLSNEPQAGVGLFNVTSSSSPSVPMFRYVSRASGNVYEGSLVSTGLTRVTNTTIPKVYEALWQSAGKNVVLRYLDKNQSVVTTYGKISAVNSTATSTDGAAAGNFAQVQASFLPPNIYNLSVSPVTGALAYVVAGTNGSGSLVMVANSTGAGAKQVYSSAIRDLSVAWVNGNTLALTTKPSAGVEGELYFIKTDTGRVQRVLGGISGLTALASPDGTKVLYSESSDSGINTTLLTLKTGVKMPLQLQTLAQKCVWSADSSAVYCARPKNVPTGAYPDSWYKGLVSFSDSFWKIDTTSGSTQLILDPTNAGTNLDATNLKLDKAEEYIVFTNKKDLQLWGLRIMQGS